LRIKTVVLFGALVAAYAARADVPFGESLSNGNVTIMVTAVRWSGLAAVGIPVVPDQPDVVQVFILSASPATTGYTVRILCSVDGATAVTVTRSARRVDSDPTLIQLPVGTIHSSVIVQALQVTEQVDAAEADF
jgi:hypothetical protein